MLTLYDSAFSPFARKVRLVLDQKGLAYSVLDGLALANREELAKVNDYATGAPPREILQDLLWVLLNSREFLFNH